MVALNDPMALRRIIYSSQVATGEPPTLDDLQHLVFGARNFNGLNGVTGMLWSDGSKFIQAIEGTRIALAEVMERIMHDPLHHNVIIHINMPVLHRGFGDWAMALQTNELTDEGEVLKMSDSRIEPPILLPRFSWSLTVRYFKKITFHFLVTLFAVLVAYWFIKILAF